MPSITIDVSMKDVQDNVNRLLRKKIKPIYYEENVNEIAELYKDAIEHYVPLKEGNLRGGARVEDGAVVYSAKAKRKSGMYDYAEYQYENEFSKRHTPGTYGHWNTHLTSAEKQAFYADVKDIIVECMNNG